MQVAKPEYIKKKKNTTFI